MQHAVALAGTQIPDMGTHAMFHGLEGAQVAIGQVGLNLIRARVLGERRVVQIDDLRCLWLESQMEPGLAILRDCSGNQPVFVDSRDNPGFGNLPRAGDLANACQDD